MELRSKKVIVGLALTGLGLIASEIKKRRKTEELTKRLHYTEDLLEELDEKAWSLNRSMKEIAKAHNSLIKMRIDDYEDFDERFYEIEDEVATIYSHIAELDRLKKNEIGVGENIDESDEKIEKLME